MPDPLDRSQDVPWWETVADVTADTIRRRSAPVVAPVQRQTSSGVPPVALYAAGGLLLWFLLRGRR